MSTYRSPIANIQIQRTKHVVGSIARTVLALTFLFSGFVKAVDPLGTVYKIEDYLQLGFGGVLEWAIPIAGGLAVTLITVEILLGVCMLFNVCTKWTSIATLLFYLIMTPVTLYIAIDNPVTDCGCFGDALVISNWQTFGKNVVLLLMTIILLICRKAIPRLFSWWAELIIALIALGATAGIMGYSYTHLPFIDFRPYKVGADVKELTQGPSPDTWDVTLIYEKDGEQQEFTLENYPKDGEWTFVDQISTPCKLVNGKKEPISLEPKVKDFVLTQYFNEEMDGFGEEYTDVILDLEKVTLIAMYDLDKRDKTQALRAVDLCKELLKKGEECYILTGSNIEEVMAFADEMELSYDVFLYLDKTPLKTIVRANPGIVVMEDGVIVSKNNMRQL